MVSPDRVDFGSERESLGLPEHIDPRSFVYKASPTLAKFHKLPIESSLGNDRVEVRCVRGPVGSGKTAGVGVWDAYIQAHLAEPCKDGVRRTRFVIIRNSYPDLVSTSIKSLTTFFSTDLGYPRVVYGSPIRWEHRWEYPDQPDVDLQIWFLSLDKPNDVRKLRGLETTFICMSECGELLFDVLEMATGRCGRYPSKIHKPDHIHPDHFPSRYGVTMETNSPSDSHWLYDLEQDPPEGYVFLRQPGGMSKDAENLENLPGGRDYYVRQMRGKSQPWIAAYVHNQFATITSGLPVYPEFNEDLHVSKESLAFLPEIELQLGWDFGLTPACAVAQVSARGQLRILKEYVTKITGKHRNDSGMLDGQMGTKKFAKTVVRPGLKIDFPNVRAGIDGVGDPGGNAKESDELSAIDHVVESGLPCKPCYTNIFEERREAVADLMNMLIDGQPALIIDPSCKTLIRGMQGEYSYDRMQVATAERYKLVPDKQGWTTHINDAVQYIACQAYRNGPHKKKLPPPRKRRVIDPAYGR